MSEPKDAIPVDVPEPMEQDVSEGHPAAAVASAATEALPIVAPQQQPQQPPANRGIFQKVFGSKQETPPQVEPPKRILTYSEKYDDLVNRELGNNGLPADDYACLFMMDIILGKRAYLDTMYRALYRHPKDDVLKSLAPLSEYVSSWNVRGAIRYIRGLKLKTDKLTAYLAELENRLLAVNLIMVARTYSSLNPDYLCKLLEISAVEEANTVFTACQWHVVEGKVAISYNNAIDKYVYSNLFNAEMGPFELLEKVLPKSKSKEKLPMDRIKELMTISDKLLKVSMPKVHSEESVAVS